MNASGALCTTENDLFNLGRSNAGAIVTKSCTFSSREGNSFPRYYYSEDSSTSINSMGIPNLGSKFYIEYIKSKTIQKPFIISIAETKPNEFHTIINIIKEQIENKVLIECNLSCPNVISQGKACSIVAYDFQLLEQKLQELCDLCRDSNISLGVKLPPYFDPHHFDIVSQLLIKYNVNFITTINSLPNGLIVNTDTETTCIRPKDGIGGIGGAPCKAIALSNVYQFYKRLPSSINIIGCGGISTGADVFDFILCGASAVQIGTAFVEKGIEIFQIVTKELKKLWMTRAIKDFLIFRVILKLFKIAISKK